MNWRGWMCNVALAIVLTWTTLFILQVAGVDVSYWAAFFLGFGIGMAAQVADPFGAFR